MAGYAPYPPPSGYPPPAGYPPPSSGYPPPPGSGFPGYPPAPPTYAPPPYQSAAPLPFGVYKIKTNGHRDGRQPAGWGLSAWNGPEHGAQRNGESTWVAVHEGEHWPCLWSVEPGTVAGTYRLKTMGHADGRQPAGWGLSAWNAHGAKRNDSSSRVAVHEGSKWPCDWIITPGSVPGTFRIKTNGHAEGHQPAGWGLSAWHGSEHGGQRNGSSSWVYVHEGDHWPCDWILERVG